MLNKPIYNAETERLDHINESLSLIQLKNGLTFGTDSYLLAAFARTMRKETCIELGGGTGVVSLLMASRDKYTRVHAIEVQPYFASLIGRNASLNSLSDKVIPHEGDVRLFSPADFGGEVASVVSNPPYMPAGSGKGNDSAEMNTARREENGTIDDFCASASSLLRYGGYFTVVYRPERLAELMFSMKKHMLEPKRAVLIYPYADKKPSLVLVEAKKNAAPSLTLSRPLVVYREAGSTEYTPDMAAVYDTFSLEHLF